MLDFTSYTLKVAERFKPAAEDSQAVRAAKVYWQLIGAAHRLRYTPGEIAPGAPEVRARLGQVLELLSQLAGLHAITLEDLARDYLGRKP